MAIVADTATSPSPMYAMQFSPLYAICHLSAEAIQGKNAKRVVRVSYRFPV